MYFTVLIIPIWCWEVTNEKCSCLFHFKLVWVAQQFVNSGRKKQFKNKWNEDTGS